MCNNRKVGSKNSPRYRRKLLMDHDFEGWGESSPDAAAALSFPRYPEDLNLVLIPSTSWGLHFVLCWRLGFGQFLRVSTGKSDAEGVSVK